MKSLWAALLRLKEDSKELVVEERGFNVELAPYLSSKKAIESSKSDIGVQFEVLNNIGKYIRHTPCPTSLIRTGTPLYADVACFLSRTNTEMNDLRCIFGLQALTESLARFKSQMCNDKAGIECRLRALKFAQEATYSINSILQDASMPCRCTRTLAFHLEVLKAEFAAFLCEKNFSVTFQSPWVCGSHVLEMLETSFYYGLRLLSYRNYVGAVLHSYNILRVAAAFEEVPVLEALIAAYGSVIFPAERPSRNFWACWTRFTGCRLSFDSSKNDHRNGKHHMIVPAHTAREAIGFDGKGLRKEANDSRFDYRRISLFYYTKRSNYVSHRCLFDSIHPSNSSTRCTSELQKQHSEPEGPGLASERLLHLQSRISAEFTGKLPVAKVNIFTFYLACVNVIDIITKEIHTEGQPDRCICFVRELALAADHARDHGRIQQPLGSKDVVKAFAKAVQEVLQHKSCDDFLWRSI